MSDKYKDLDKLRALRFYFHKARSGKVKLRGNKQLRIKMNPIDVNKAQVQAYGNQVVYTQNLDQSEKSLMQSMLADMTKSGKTEEAFKIILDMIEDMEKRIRELEQK